MQSVVCTLFENNYHYGVNALTNSLYNCGFRGSVYAGYRGDLPPWVLKAKSNFESNWKGATTLIIGDEMLLHFLPVNTDYHLTNYKPDFMLDLWTGPAKEADVMYYFDPDIVLCAPWQNFEDWVQCGVALCEDVNSPLANYHPVRVAWRNYFKTYNINLFFKEAVYVNGGFIGLNAQNISFLHVWQSVQQKMGLLIGGLSRSAFKSAEKLHPSMDGPLAPFNKTDQDALNVTIEAWSGTVSVVGKSGMGFEQGAALMLHALAQPKPWMAGTVKQMINAQPPRLADHAFWQASLKPLRIMPVFIIKYRILMLKIASFFGRFYSRN